MSPNDAVVGFVMGGVLAGLVDLLDSFVLQVGVHLTRNIAKFCVLGR